MKNYIICVILVLTSIVACKKELVEQPYLITQGNFYNTQIEAEAGAAAIYTGLRSAFAGLYLVTTESSTDIFRARDNWGQISLFEGLEGDNRNQTETFWASFYTSIRNANIMIDAIPRATGLNDSLKRMYVGEARFLRALAYFHLVRCWGGVPLRVETNLDQVDLPRSSVDEVYKLIIDDLIFAENNLPAAPSVAGRGSKWTAKAVLADVYFTRKDNTSARNIAQEIIQSGKFDLVEVPDSNSFNNIYGPAASGSTKEEIFYIKYSQQSVWGWPRYLVAGSGGDLKTGGYYIPTGRLWLPFYKNWDDNEIRKAWDTRLLKQGDSTVITCTKFRDPDFPDARNSYPLYRYADILLLFAEADCLASGAPTAAGMEALNRTHRRAYGFNTKTASAVDFSLSNYDKDQFLDLVLSERGKETYGEGKRWFDLLRTGKLKQMIKDAYGIDVKDKHLLWPIPNAEINFNLAISPSDNNPGY